jgi:eukaryotic-like serine/threonine-protein kinase
MFPTEAVPERIGDYTVVKYLGRNGAADVYVARKDGPLGFQRLVSLKMVRFAIDDDARFAEELGREAAICSRLNHPAVVRMYDFFEHDRRLVLVLEQVEGASLERLLTNLARRRHQLGDSSIYYIGSQIASALAHAHASVDEDGHQTPVIHRDIRPDNVLVGWDGQVRLAGFGLGKILGRTPDSVAGTISGTPGFMSPEQARGERATVRSDVYGLGALLWSLFAHAEPPRDGGTPQLLSELRPDLPPEIVGLVHAALEPSADRRKISCAEIAKWLSTMRPEQGRDELRRHVVVLRSSRGAAADPHDPAARARPAARRRQALAARLPGRRASAPPSTRAPISRRTAAEMSVHIPPPPALPSDPSSGDDQHDSEPPTRIRDGQPPSSRVPRPSARKPEATPRSGNQPVSRTSPPRGTQSTMPLRPGHVTIRPASTTMRPPGSMSVHSVASVPMRSVPPPSLRPAPLMASGEEVSVLDPGSGFVSESVFTPDATDLRLGPPPITGFDGHLAQHHGQQDARGSGGHYPQERQLPVIVQMALAALTAGLVVAIGLFVIEVNRRDPVLVQAPATPVAPAPPPERTVSEPVAAKPSDPEPPKPAEPIEGSGRVVRPKLETADVQALPIDPSREVNTDLLSPQEGFLTVKGPSMADVYLNGMHRGPTNRPLRVVCGRFYLRLAPPDPGRFPAWIGPGETVSIPCRASTVFTSKLASVSEGGAGSPEQTGRGTGL